MTLPTSITGNTANLVDVLERGINAYPCHIAWGVQQGVRDAIALYREGNRDPELLLFIVAAFSSYNDNALRYRLHDWVAAALTLFAV